MWRRRLRLAALIAFLSTGASEPALAISGSAGTGVAVAAQHSEHGDGLSLDDERIADAEPHPDRQRLRELRAAATDEAGLPVSGWMAFPGLVLGLVILTGGVAARKGLTEPA